MIKREYILFFSVLPLLSGAALAQSDMPAWLDGSFYVGAKGGGNWVAGSTVLNSTFNGLPVQGQADYKTGYIGAIQGGYALDLGFRLEVEGAIRDNSLNKVQGAIPGQGDIRNYTTTLNGLYDIPVDFAVRPYVGIGVGAADYNPYHVALTGNPSPGVYTGVAYQSNDAWSFAYQAIAGVSYNVDRNISLTLEYRFMELPDQHHAANVTSDYQSNSALIGIRYAFGGAPAERPAPAAAYVPPPVIPAPPPVPHNYLVFFDFNKSDLTTEAKRVVDGAARNAMSAKVTRIELVGHTDTVGSDAYNMRLSQRRALSVEAELERDGVSANQITVVAKGKRSPLVPTRDGVREPQNRRVQILMSGDGPSS